jgi:hypothetical protein
MPHHFLCNGAQTFGEETRNGLRLWVIRNKDHKLKNQKKKVKL